MKIIEKYLDFKTYNTYVRIVGAEYKKAPLIILHGGPGSTANSYELLDPIADLDKRPIIMYDQIGCGKSFVEVENPNLFFKSELFIEELENLITKLKIKDYHLLGHSWGGMLAMLYLTKKKRCSCLSAIFSSSLASTATWSKETKRLLKYLSNKDIEIFNLAERGKNYSSEEYKIAYSHYVNNFIGPVDKTNLPECLKRAKIKGQESYLSMWGENEFTPSGNLKNYDVKKKLNKLNLPCLIISGTDDESTPLVNKEIYDSLQCYKKWILYPNARHMTYFDCNEQYIKDVIEFLNDVENKTILK